MGFLSYDRTYKQTEYIHRCVVLKHIMRYLEEIYMNILHDIQCVHINIEHTNRAELIDC